jgi:hypothetical protein
MISKVQFQSSEVLKIRFPAFVNRTTNAVITGDICTIVVRKPDNSTVSYSDITTPVVSFDSSLGIWTLNLTTGLFMQGEWLVKATSSDVNANPQVAALNWGDYVEDITISAQVAFGRWKISGNQLVLYRPDNTTVLKTFNLKDDTGAASMTRIFERVPV